MASAARWCNRFLLVPCNSYCVQPCVLAIQAVTDALYAAYNACSAAFYRCVQAVQLFFEPFCMPIYICVRSVCQPIRDFCRWCYNACLWCYENAATQCYSCIVVVCTPCNMCMSWVLERLRRCVSKMCAAVYMHVIQPIGRRLLKCLVPLAETIRSACREACNWLRGLLTDLGRVLFAR